MNYSNEPSSDIQINSESNFISSVSGNMIGSQSHSFHTMETRMKQQEQIIRELLIHIERLTNNMQDMKSQMSNIQGQVSMTDSRVCTLIQMVSEKDKKTTPAPSKKEAQVPVAPKDKEETKEILQEENKSPKIPQEENKSPNVSQDTLTSVIIETIGLGLLSSESRTGVESRFENLTYKPIKNETSVVKEAKSCVIDYIVDIIRQEEGFDKLDNVSQTKKIELAALDFRRKLENYMNGQIVRAADFTKFVDMLRSGAEIKPKKK